MGFAVSFEWADQARLLKTGREPTNELSGKHQPLTKPKPSNVRRKPIPGSTWNGCAFATSGILTYGRISLAPLQSPREGLRLSINN